MTEQVRATLEIRRNADGLIRQYVDEAFYLPDPDPCESRGSVFWYTEGNAGCDCNRGLFFARAAGEPDPEIPCGETAYSILRAVTDDGRIVVIDGTV
jgi:hypothetical protein